MYSRPFTFGELYALLCDARYKIGRPDLNCEELARAALARAAMERRKTQRRERLGKRGYDRGLGNWNWGCDFHPSKGRRQARKDRRKPVEA